MNKNRLIFYAVFAAYHLITVFITLVMYVKSADPLNLLPLLKYMSLFLIGSLVGVVLLLVDFVWYWKDGKDNAQKEEALMLENNTLKAKIYDLQEEKKTNIQSPSAIK